MESLNEDEEEDVALHFTTAFERGAVDELEPLPREHAADGTNTNLRAAPTLAAFDDEAAFAHFDDAHRRRRIAPGTVVAILVAGAVIAVAFVALFSIRTASSSAAPRASEPMPPAPTPAAEAPSPPPQHQVARPPVPPPSPPVVPSFFVRIPVTSIPSGATVTVLDRGEARTIGRTPVELALDPARGYDVIVAMAKHPTRLVHVTPAKVSRLAIDLSPPPGR